MQERPRTKERSAREKPRRDVEGHAVDVKREQTKEAHVRSRGENQRSVEVLTELAIRYPGPRPIGTRTRAYRSESAGPGETARCTRWHP